MKKAVPKVLYVRLSDIPDWDGVEWMDYDLNVFDDGEKIAEYRLVRTGTVELNTALKPHKGGSVNESR